MMALAARRRAVGAMRRLQRPDFRWPRTWPGMVARTEGSWTPEHRSRVLHLGSCYPPSSTMGALKRTTASAL